MLTSQNLNKRKGKQVDNFEPSQVNHSSLDGLDQLYSKEEEEEDKGEIFLKEYESSKKFDTKFEYIGESPLNRVNGTFLDKAIDMYLKYQFWVEIIVLTLLAMITRYHRIAEANKPIWDEVHFGKFGSYYLRGSFYHDVHPPLGKMLVGFGGKLAGYDGTFKFEGGDFPEGMKYGIMRVFHATFGVALVPLAYATSLKLGMSNRAAVLSACMILFDNGFTVISKFILLDSMLLCFIALSYYYLASFIKVKSSPFSFDWWYHLIMLGLSLGLASSVKWIGLFAVALVGLYTIEELYTMLDAKPFSTKKYAKHWLARILCLIFIPISVYMFCFKLHFFILNNSGPGDATMDSLFQYRLNRNKLALSPLELTYLGNATIRSSGLHGGLLHSHESDYPSGSKDQQITCYGYSDNNNDWTINYIKGYEFTESSQTIVKIKQHSIDNNDTISPNLKELMTNPVKVKSGDLIRLTHVQTLKNLRVQKEFDSPVTGKRAYEVSGSGNLTDSNEFDTWKIEVYDDVLQPTKPGTIQTITTRFQLRNTQTNCLLAKSDTKLPEWGFGQDEVYCIKDGNSKDEETLWNIETLRHEGVPPAPSRHIPSTFLRDFIRLNRAMWSTNNALTPDEDKFDHLTSKATDWPLMRRGIRMCGWGDDEVKYYMLGNPMVWWGSTIGLFTIAGLNAFYQTRKKRKYKDFTKVDYDAFTLTSKLILIGYLLQYLPFFIMGRVLYIHHYFPSLYIAQFTIPFIFDHITHRIPIHSIYKAIFFYFHCFVLMVTFWFFSPITYGFYGSPDQLSDRRWLSSWTWAGSEAEYLNH